MKRIPVWPFAAGAIFCAYNGLRLCGVFGTPHSASPFGFVETIKGYVFTYLPVLNQDSNGVGFIIVALMLVALAIIVNYANKIAS